MEQNKKAFRLHLNLFDGIVILVALGVAAILLWSQLKPAVSEVGSDTQPIRYTIRMMKAVPGTGEMVQDGQILYDAVKNFELGSVVSAETVQAYDLAVDNETHSYVNVEVPDKEDIYIVMDSTAVISDEAVTLSSGFAIRVGETLYLRGPGYLGTGRIHAIERGE